ncbi:hypothetical protein PGN35_000095 [Nodosilinea sp. PGN35]|uniref:hypothetical protein n=1 Tax=Nodosilinea sp. PGN35 TaxID=3020489 RepID=UPI0023B27964|nr:hypothetical protein [Nodosilinea sp. TSF1-S3]MDF0369187.1 hypothetical protein [Nodosilinea sp. TSF1-S3]
MNVKEAVARAKQYIFELFPDENPKNIGLEEVEFDEQTNEWLVTVGVSRPWDALGESPFAAFSNRQMPTPRAYRIVRISNDKDEVLSMKFRELKV